MNSALSMMAGSPTDIHRASGWALFTHQCRRFFIERYGLLWRLGFLLLCAAIVLRMQWLGGNANPRLGLGWNGFLILMAIDAWVGLLHFTKMGAEYGSFQGPRADGLLRMTGLSRRGFALSFAAGCGVRFCLILLSQIPLVVLCFWLGGVTVELLVSGMLLVLSSFFLLLALFICIAAGVGVLRLTLLLTCLLLPAWGILGTLHPGLAEPYLREFGRFNVLVGVLEIRYGELAPWPAILANLAGGMAALFLAWRAPEREEKDSQAARTVAKSSAKQILGEPVFYAKPRPPEGVRAFRWQLQYPAGRKPMHWWGAWLIIPGIAAAAGVGWVIKYGTVCPFEKIAGAMADLGLFLAVATSLGAAFALFAKDTGGNTLSALVMLPVPVTGIIREKTLAMLPFFTPHFFWLVFGATFAGPGWWSEIGSPNASEIICAFTIWAVALMLSALAGLQRSLSRSNVAACAVFIFQIKLYAAHGWLAARTGLSSSVYLLLLALASLAWLAYLIVRFPRHFEAAAAV